MHQAFAHDLRVARKKSGLSQRDCAHLLDIRQQRISALETGDAIPTLSEICGLSLIFGKSFTSLFTAEFAIARRFIDERLSTLPADKRTWISRFNRTNTLSKLAERIATDNPLSSGSV
ncbi:MAG: helix-turn-helix transcriptional regulator [Pseudomonadota bacterium]